MVSQARSDANRKNAQKSTGPKTVEGKKRSCMNAMVHGLRSEHVCLPTEDKAAFDTHLNEFIQEWQPVTKTRMHLVTRIAVSTWKLDRCGRVETGRLSERAMKALRAWDQEREIEIKRSVDRLDRIPSRAIAELESTRDGVRTLVEMWRGLESAAMSKGDWNDSILHHKRFFLLQGIDPADDLENSHPLLRFLLASRPELAEEVGLEPLEDAKFEPMRQLILKAIHHKMNHLIQLWNFLPDQSEARTRYAELEALMPQPEDASLLRYEAHFDREFRASVNQLTRLTKTGDDLIDASDLLSVESEIPTITDVESPAPNEAKPEPEAAPPASEAPNEAKPVATVEPVWESDGDKIGRALDAYRARVAADRLQSDRINR